MCLLYGRELVEDAQETAEAVTLALLWSRSLENSMESRDDGSVEKFFCVDRVLKVQLDWRWEEFKSVTEN